MSRSHFPELHAILVELLSELEGYESHIRRLVQEWHAERDVVLYGEAGKAMERMRLLAVAVPQLSVPWAMVVISHAELMHNLWRVLRGATLEPALETEDHIAAVTTLATHCRRLLVQDGPVLH